MLLLKAEISLNNYVFDSQFYLLKEIDLSLSLSPSLSAIPLYLWGNSFNECDRLFTHLFIAALRSKRD